MASGNGGANGRPADAHWRWLWVDPRREADYSGKEFDVRAFLKRAIAVFVGKAWTGGEKPGRLAVHPTLTGNGLERVAQDLGLVVLTDVRITPQTYRLALRSEEEAQIVQAELWPTKN